MHGIGWWLILVISGVLAITSCRKDNDFIRSDARFELSQDTLLFDTVFTSIGSVTKYVKIFNRESSPILVDVRLSGGSSSFYRLNVDGFQGNELSDIEIGPRDSIYVFMEVTIDPDQPLSVSPFIIEEDLIVSQGGSQQIIKIISWGQNANYISNKGSIARLSCNNSTLTFDDPKPYVIYGILVVDSCELVIPAGARVHVHGGVIVNEDGVYNDGMLIIFPDGKLTVNGTADNPVYFEGSRLDPFLDETSGQWVGLRFWAGARNNEIHHARIKNSIIGLIADSASQITVTHTEIKNTSGASIRGIHADIHGENLLLHGTAASNIECGYGGNYTFDYCTIVGASGQSAAVSINNLKCNDLEADPLCQQLVSINKPTLKMNNCIIYGPKEDEFLFFNHPLTEIDEGLSFDLKNCIIRVDELLDPDGFPNFFDNCSNCINLKRDDILFREASENDFRLDTASIAEMQAIPLPTISTDLLGMPRDVQTPDIGCYEYEN